MRINETIVALRNKHSLPSWGYFLTLGGLILSTFALIAILALPIIFPNAPANEQGMTDWVQVLINHLDVVITLIFVIGLIPYQYRVQKLERLILSPDGIRYISPLPSSLKRFKPDWSIPWDQIKTVELGVLNDRGHSALLTLTSGSNVQRIFPTSWVDPENYVSPSFLSLFALPPLTLRHEKAIKSAMASEVIQYMSRSAPHISISSTQGKTKTNLSLERSSHGRIAIGIVFLLLAYAFIDFLVGPESYIDEPSSLLHIYISAGIMSAILSGIWLRKSALMLAEKIGLAVLIGIVFGVAMIPGALRINEITDSHAAPYEYWVTQNKNKVVLQPVAKGLPDIDYFSTNEFWKKFGADDTYPVYLHKGILGFYQFNSSSITDDIYKHNEK